MKSEVSDLVDEGVRVQASMKENKKRLEEISAELIARGAGEHTGTDGRKANVIFPSAAVKTPKDEESLARVKKLTGTLFAKLFDKKTTFSPVKSFRDVAAALLTPAKASKVIAECEEEPKAYVKFSA